MRFPILVISFLLVTSPLWGKIVFYSFRAGNGNIEIYTMDSDGGNQTRLTFNGTSDAAPAWSPNGQQIVFDSNRDGNSEIYVMDADGQNQRRLTHHPSIDSYPDWSPDGSQIAFDSGRGRGEATVNIFVMDTNGGNVRQVTHMGFASRPKWSPDGKRILFTEAINHSYNDATLIIATLHPTRREVVHFDRVNIPKRPIRGGAWGADGKSILFTTRPPDGSKNLDWNIYRFRLTDRKLIQLTDHVWRDQIGHEWNPSLSVPQQGLIPLFWGEIKSNRSRY